MNEYRVVRADGVEPFPDWEPMTLADAQTCAMDLNRRASGLPGLVYRVQRMVWEDVPEPEPLPDLPTEVWCRTFEGGAPIQVPCRPSRPGDPRWRNFRGTVTEWQEVTG